MITISFKNSEPIVAAMRAKGPQIVEALAAKLLVLMIKLEQKIVGEKLQGQVLHHRSGTLSGSIHHLPVLAEGSKLIGRVEGAGGAAAYGFVHEYGGKGTYVINAKHDNAKGYLGALRFEVGGKAVFARYVFHPPLPQRAFMAPSLAEMKEQIVSELFGAVAGVLANG